MSRIKKEKTKKVNREKKQREIYRGTFISNSKGFGFVEVEGLEEDIFIPRVYTLNAFHHDIVEVVVTKQAAKSRADLGKGSKTEEKDTRTSGKSFGKASGKLSQSQGSDKRAEGKIVQILEHQITQIVGSYDRAKGFGFVIPDNQKIDTDIFVSKENSMGAVTGHKVVALITDYGDDRHKPEGKIVEILGHENDPGVDIISIVKAYDLPNEFPEKVLNQANRVAHEVSEADMNGRLDLRNLMMVTIDGEDAKDLDDAVSLYMEDGLYHLGVHIADVANYVQESSALDKEALERGTSVYLVDRVIPMLPHVLSNGMCSLNMGEDRLALSCLMTIDQNGQIIDHKIAETVINVDERMNYTDVNVILEEGTGHKEASRNENLRADGRGEVTREEQDAQGDNGDVIFREEQDGPATDGNDVIFREAKDAQGAGADRTSKAQDLARRYEKELPMFFLMEELSEKMRINRRKRGSIDFDFPESKIILNKKGVPVKISAYERGKAQKIIEDFMLAANETVAEHFFWMESPFLYRVHATPDPEKILKLGTFINNFGYSLKLHGGNADVHPKEIQKLLGRIEGTPEEALISRITLRSMKRAEYSVDCLGHFGLACNYYSHFTSPIRRYPDLQIHRIIKDHLRGRMNDRKASHYNEILPQIAHSTSAKERRADEAERETEKLKKAQYMTYHIGEEFEGVISGVTAWGLYVELPNTVEGMIHVSELSGDYYMYDEAAYEMVGRDTGRVYKLGQCIKILVKEVDMTSKTIDFLEAREDE